MRVVQHNIDDDRQKTAEQRSAVVDLAAAGCAVPGGTAVDELVTPDVSEHGGEVDPALSDDLEVGRVGRSYLVGAEGLSIEQAFNRLARLVGLGDRRGDVGRLRTGLSQADRGRFEVAQMIVDFRSDVAAGP